jgi:hypothetical protein
MNGEFFNETKTKNKKYVAIILKSLKLYIKVLSYYDLFYNTEGQP